MDGRGQVTGATLDHIVWACDDLGRGSERIERLTGMTPHFGGVHANGRTQNALLALGERCYLEVLAPVGRERADDDEWTRGARSAGEGRVLTYCLRSPRPLVELAAIAAARGWSRAQVQSNGRTRPDGVQLRWRWLAPVAVPFGAAFPFFIDWMDSPHPAEPPAAATGGAGLRLHQFSVGHPQARELARAIAEFGCIVETHDAPITAFRVQLDSPRGRVWL
jgi:Glyoxalase-like domain